MRFKLPDEVSALAAYVPHFLSLAGEKRWKKRAVQLSLDAHRSPVEGKIVEDYHWVEMELSLLAVLLECGQSAPKCADGQLLAALRFAGMAVEVSRRLSTAGRSTLDGRLRDGLKAGFASLYRELEMALLLLDEGFDVDFPDLEGIGRADLSFCKGPIEGEVECKSQSVDAGRKIHRRDFYRFISKIEHTLIRRAENGARDVLVVTIEDRFPRDVRFQASLLSQVEKVLSSAIEPPVSNNCYSVELQPIDVLGLREGAALEELMSACRQEFGATCHVAGSVSSSGASIFVARSKLDDDTSKPLLEAMKKAHEQLSGRQPGFIALQLDDIEPEALTYSHLRRRLAILTTALFNTRDSRNLAGVYVCPFRSVHYHNDHAGIPAIMFWNSNLQAHSEGLPFRRSMSNGAFADMFGVSPEHLAFTI